MFFARVRWIGRVLDGAGIDTNSKTGKELSSTLITFSKYCQEKNRRGDGAGKVRRDFGPAEWALMGAILAPVEPQVGRQLIGALGLTPAEATKLLSRVRASALELAEQWKPGLLTRVLDQ